jgi:urease accessory protein
MTASPSSLLAILLADARLPVGGHTQSGGLEPGLTRGLTADGVPAYCRTRLSSVARTEAATAIVSRHRANQLLPLAVVEQHWAARTPSDAMRTSSRQLGRGLVRLAQHLWPGAPALVALEALDNPPRPVVLGAIAAAVGLSAEDLARVVGYDDVQTVVAAALKLLPLDPAVTTSWVWDLLPEVEALARELADLTEPIDIPAQGAPEIEAWAQAHARTTRRLFSA